MLILRLQELLSPRFTCFAVIRIYAAFSTYSIYVFLYGHVIGPTVFLSRSRFLREFHFSLDPLDEAGPREKLCSPNLLLYRFALVKRGPLSYYLVPALLVNIAANLDGASFCCSLTRKYNLQILVAKWRILHFSKSVQIVQSMVQFENIRG